MKKNLITTKLCVQVFAAVCALTVATGAEAKCKSFTKCLKEGSKDIGTVLKEQGAPIGKSEMTSLLNDAKDSYSDSAGAVTNGYNKSVSSLKNIMNAALDGIWREAGNKYLKKNGAFILDMKHRAQSLDSDGTAALNRVKRAIAAKDLDEQGRTDMQLLMKKIVFGGNNIPDSVKNSSFGIQICASVGMGYSGGGSCFMMIMQTYLENGVYKVGLAQSVGVDASPAPSDFGADPSFGLFWGPGGISDNGGPSIGVDMGAVLDEGVEAGLSWGVPMSMPNPDSAIPGVSVTIGDGVKGKATLSAGYTQIIGKF